MTINCIIIDDDIAVQIYLKTYITQIPFFNLVATYKTAEDALETLGNNYIQLVFLDIGMPGMNGMEFARILNSQQGAIAPRIIFVTGFERFAVDSYQVNALDYLLKPIVHEDFIKSAYRAKSYFENLLKSPEAIESHQSTEYLFLKVEHQLVRVDLKDITYIESFKDYVKIFFKGETRWIKALTTLKSLEEKLPALSFMRIHRSFIISLDKIEAVYHQTIKIGNATIPVTEQYRGSFKDFIEQWQ